MKQYIRLTKELELGCKIVPPGIILQLDMASMKRLVKDKSAFWCTPVHGRRLKVDEEE